MKRTCCRSTPRCSGCPVRLIAATRRHGKRTETAALIDEIFAGRPARSLPQSVAAALEHFHVAREQLHVSREPAPHAAVSQR